MGIPSDGVELVVEPGSRSAEAVFESLDHKALAECDAYLEVRRTALRFRAVDPAILVATIGAVGTSLTALIGGFLQAKTLRKGQRIAIELASGTKIEVPADLSAEELRVLLESLDEAPKRIILP